MKTLLTVLAFLISVAVIAQDTTFNKRYYDSDQSDIGSTMISPNNNSGIVVCGGVFDYKGLVLDVDSIGGINWNKTIQSTSSYSLTTDIFTSSDTSVIVSGYNYSTSNDSIKSVFCMKLNFQGDTLWTNTFVFDAPYLNWEDEYVGISELDSNTYILVASSYNDSIMKVVRMKESGSIDWEINIEDVGFKANEIHVDSDSTFLITGSVNMEDGFILKIDEIGTPIWSKSYESLEIYDIVSLHEEIYILGQDSQSSKKLWLLKLDSIGNAIWSEPTYVRYEQYGDKILSSMPDLVVLNDTLLGVVGSGIEVKDTSGLSIKTLDLFPMRWSHVAANDSGRVFISGNGPSYGIKAQVYQGQFGVIFTNIYLDETQCTWENSKPNYDTIVVNIDTLVTQVSNASSLMNQTYVIESLPLIVDNECVEFYGSVEVHQSTQVLVYPNITTGKTNFELSKSGKYQVEIIDVNGNRVAAFEINGSFGSFDLSDKPAGMYFYKVFNENISLTGKIIKR